MSDGPMVSPQHPSQILIVDDEPTQRLLVMRALTLDGHICREADSAGVARSILAAGPTVDLVISDINMPGESGMGLVRWMAQAHPEAAILMATAVDDRATADEAIAMGSHGYLIKPFELNELRIAVNNALRRHYLERLQVARSQELELLVAERTQELRETARTLRDSENRLASLVSSAPVGVLYTDPAGACEYVNETAAAMSGHAPEELLGHGFLSIVHPDDLHQVAQQLDGSRWGSRPATLEHRVLRPDGQELRAHTRVAPVVDDEGETTAFVAVVEDVTEQRRFERELAHQATHDDLTGLPNRHLLLDRIEQVLLGGAGMVLLIDLDRFKFVNDLHGHSVGDRLLVAAAEALVSEFGEGVTVARFGGDEFVVVSPAATDTEVADTAERALVALSRLQAVSHQTIAVSASIGVARVRPTSTADDLLRGADIAMYRAKERGGSRYEVFDDDLGRVLRERVRTEGELRAAVERNEFEVHYQPQVRCSDGQLIGVEALVRWRHPARGLLPAGAFLPAAFEAGLMELVTDFVLVESLRQAIDWAAETPCGQPVGVAVNVGAHELESGVLRTRVAAALASSGLDPHYLTLEVTEGSLIHDLGRSALRLDALRALGVRTSLDDFGTGYSSLSYLSRLPLDELKIDRAFVQRMGQVRQAHHNPLPDRQLVEAIIELAAIFELDVVAEGIETRHELELLGEMGCLAAQGFLTGRPMQPRDPRLLALIHEQPGVGPAPAAVRPRSGDVRRAQGWRSGV